MILKKALLPETVSLIVLILMAISMQTWGSHGSLDAKFYYSAAEARVFLSRLSATEITDYFRNEIFDLVFLSSYTTLFILLVRRLYPKKPALHAWAIVPGLFDLAETVTILLLLSGWRNMDPPPWLGAMTCLKWITGASVVSLILFRPWLKARPAPRRSPGPL